MEITVRELKERLEMFDENLQVVVEDAILGQADLLDIYQEGATVIFSIV